MEFSHAVKNSLPLYGITTLPTMLGKTEKNPQLNLLEVPLVQFINPEHEFCLLAKKIDWETIEKDFSVYYSTLGAPSVPIRTMVGLTILKVVYELSDKAALERWIENPYWQYFCGETNFRRHPPCSPSEFAHFRKRIGQEGEERIHKLAISVFGKTRIEKGARASTRHQKRGKMGIIDKLLFWLGLK